MDNENEEKIVKKQSEPEVEDNQSLGEKIDEGFDEVMNTIEDIAYGEKNSFQHDIPATYENGSGVRKVNKVQTRKNLNKRIFGRKSRIALGIVIILGILGGLLYYLIERLLLA